MASASRAALAMLYGDPLAPGNRAATDEMKTTSPRGRPRMDGSSDLQRRNALWTWVRMSRSTSVRSVSTTERPRLATPALQIRMSTAPKSPSTSAASPSAKALGVIGVLTDQVDAAGGDKDRRFRVEAGKVRRAQYCGIMHESHPRAVRDQQSSARSRTLRAPGCAARKERAESARVRGHGRGWKKPCRRIAGEW